MRDGTHHHNGDTITRAGTHYLLKGDLARSLKADAPAEVLASIALEAFEDEGLARAEMARLNMRHGFGPAKLLVRGAVESVGVGSRSASDLAAEAVSYVFDHVVEFVEVEDGADAAEVLARAAVDWLTGCISGGIDDAIASRREAIERQAEQDADESPICERCGADGPDLQEEGDYLACATCRNS